MAVLEFEFKGIDQNFRSSASNVLNDIDKIKKAFSSIGVGEVNVSGLKKSMDEVTASIKKAESDNKMFLANEMNQAKINILQVSSAVKNDLSSSLNQAKVNFVEAKKATQDMVTEGKSLDNQYKQTKVTIAELTLEQKKLTAEQRASRANLQDSPYSKLSRELNEMRNEAKNLGAEMLKLSMRGDTTSKEYLKLEQAFNKVQSKITPLDSSLKKLDSSLGQNQRRVGAYGNALNGFESAQGSANGVALEFTRIIQDAPYGMMGIGNNIQQLTSNFGAYRDQLAQVAAQQGKTLTSMQMFQGIATSFLSTGNLISLAVAGITSAWTFYTMQQQKANKATEESIKSRKNAKDSLDAYVESMSSLTGALLKGEQSAEKELIRLRLLNDTYKNSNASVQQRKNAYNEMISMYESYFGKLTDEQKKVFDLGKHYDQLTNAIIKTAKARALEDEMVENAKKLRALDKQRNTEVNNYNKLQQAQNDKQLTYADALLGKLGEENKALAKIGLVRQLTLTGQEDNLKEQAKINEAVNKWVITSGKIADINKDNEDIYKQINEIVSQGAVISTSFGDSVNKTNNSLNKTTDKLRQAIDYLKELQSLSGVSEKDISLVGKVGLDYSVASVKFDYEERIKQIQTLQEQILADTTLTEAKRQELIEETNTYIAYLTGNVLANIKDLSNKATEYLDRMTVKAVKTYKDVEIVESPKQRQGRNREDDKDWKDYANILNQSVNSIFTNLKSNIDEFGLKARSVFYTLGESLGDLIKQLANKNTAKFMEKLTKDAKSFSDLKDNWKNMSNQDKWSAGLGFAGGAISGLTPQTSSGGQAIGGALSGAAAGMAFGPWGAAIGAVAGGVSGLLKAAKNKRQEKILLQQYEEQKKANRLLERMNALTYASQIIGQKTEYGIVSGVRRNEYGQIVSVVQGQDIIMVADRTDKNKNR